MSVYEEKQLLRVIEACPQAVDKDPVARRLRRKLLVRQEKRERGLPLFDLDATMQQILQKVTGIRSSEVSDLILSQSPLRHLSPSKVSSSMDSGDYRILDRFQVNYCSFHWSVFFFFLWIQFLNNTKFSSRTSAKD